MTTDRRDTAEPIFATRENLPEGAYREYRKTYTPQAMRMSGPFFCLTSEGNVVSCADGWLAIDSEGHPYPIGAEEFARTYQLASEDSPAK